MTTILIMGLPGSGKSTFAKELQRLFCAEWFNADAVRQQHNDWDFSSEGRLRQATRMHDLCKASVASYAIADFVCPTPATRELLAADWVIWMDTIDYGRFADTNAVFCPPNAYDFRITEQNAVFWADYVAQHIGANQRRPVFDWRKETVQMLGRWQPWHAGHRALFDRAIKKTGQVAIQVRDCQSWNNSNPFGFEEVQRYIERDLEPLYQGRYIVQRVPNIVNITYGRDVGYTIEQEVFDDKTHAISATKIRAQMVLP
jgi:hypothetical protein